LLALILVIDATTFYSWDQKKYRKVWLAVSLSSCRLLDSVSSQLACWLKWDYSCLLFQSL